jgi:hypothetical protein
MDITAAFQDPEMGGTTFDVSRLTYTRGSGSDPTEEKYLGQTGSIHPATPEMLELLPEEERVETYIYVHTEFILSLGEDKGDKYIAPDRILWGNKVWRVVRIKDWSIFGFCNALAVLMQEGSE